MKVLLGSGDGSPPPAPGPGPPPPPPPSSTPLNVDGENLDKKAMKIMIYGKAHAGPRKRRKKKKDPPPPPIKEEEEEDGGGVETQTTADTSTISPPKAKTKKKRRKKKNAHPIDGAKVLEEEETTSTAETTEHGATTEHYYRKPSRLPLVNAAQTASDAATTVLGRERGLDRIHGNEEQYVHACVRAEVEATHSSSVAGAKANEKKRNGSVSSTTVPENKNYPLPCDSSPVLKPLKPLTKEMRQQQQVPQTMQQHVSMMTPLQVPPPYPAVVLPPQVPIQHYHHQLLSPSAVPYQQPYYAPQPYTVPPQYGVPPPPTPPSQPQQSPHYHYPQFSYTSSSSMEPPPQIAQQQKKQPVQEQQLQHLSSMIEEDPVDDMLDAPNSRSLELLVHDLAKALPNPEQSASSRKALSPTGSTSAFSMMRDSNLSNTDINMQKGGRSYSWSAFPTAPVLSLLAAEQIQEQKEKDAGVAEDVSLSSYLAGSSVTSFERQSQYDFSDSASLTSLGGIYRSYDQEREARVKFAVEMAEEERSRRIQENLDHQYQERLERARRLEWAIKATEAERKRQTRWDRVQERRVKKRRDQLKKWTIEQEEAERNRRIRKGAGADIVLAAVRRELREERRKFVEEYSDEEDIEDNEYSSLSEYEEPPDAEFSDDYEVVCPYTIVGCGTTCMRSDLETHLEVCEFRAKTNDSTEQHTCEEYLSLYNPLDFVVDCPYKVCGCKHSCSRAMLPEHLLMCSYRDYNDEQAVDVSIYDLLPATSTGSVVSSTDSSTNSSSEVGLSKFVDRGLYEVVCPYATMGCTETILRSEVGRHLRICRFAPVSRQEEEAVRNKNKRMAIAAAEHERQRRLSIVSLGGEQSREVRSRHYKNILAALIEARLTTGPSSAVADGDDGVEVSETYQDVLVLSDDDDELATDAPKTEDDETADADTIVDSSSATETESLDTARSTPDIDDMFSPLSLDHPRPVPPHSVASASPRLYNNGTDHIEVEIFDMETSPLPERKSIARQSSSPVKELSSPGSPPLDGHASGGGKTRKKYQHRQTHSLGSFSFLDSVYKNSGTLINSQNAEWIVKAAEIEALRLQVEKTALKKKLSLNSSVSVAGSSSTGRVSSQSPKEESFKTVSTVLSSQYPRLLRRSRSAPVLLQSTVAAISASKTTSMASSSNASLATSSTRGSMDVSFCEDKSTTSTEVRLKPRSQSVASHLSSQSQNYHNRHHGYAPSTCSQESGKSLNLMDTSQKPSRGPTGTPHAHWLQHHMDEQIDGLHRRLDQDLLDLSRKCDEGLQRYQHTISEVQHRVQRVASFCVGYSVRCELFGSVASGLAVPKLSDLDIVIFFDHEGALNGALMCNILGRVMVNQEDWVANLKILDRARIPVIKMKSNFFSLPSVNVDITIGSPGHMGLRTVSYTKSLVQHYPHLKPLTLALKKFLAKRELSDPFTGGLGSYALVLMIVASLSTTIGRRRSASKKASLSGQLLSFLELYGTHYDPQEGAVVCVSRKDMMTMKVGKRFHANCLKHIHNNNNPSAVLVIDDPVQLGNNVGSSCFRFADVQRAFADLYAELLVYTVRCKTIESGQSNTSLLEQLLFSH